MVLPYVCPGPTTGPPAPLQGVLRLPAGWGVVIPIAAYGIHEDPVTRERRIESAEDRADQVAFDAMRERTSYAASIEGFNARMFEIQAEHEAAERADRECS